MKLMQIYEFVNDKAKLNSTTPYISKFEYEGQEYVLRGYVLIYTLSNGSKYFAKCNKDEANGVYGGGGIAYAKDIKIVNSAGPGDSASVQSRLAALDNAIRSEENQDKLQWIKFLMSTKSDGTMSPSEYAKLIDSDYLRRLKIDPGNIEN